MVSSLKDIKNCKESIIEPLFKVVTFQEGHKNLRKRHLPILFDSSYCISYSFLEAGVQQLFKEEANYSFLNLEIVANSNSCWNISIFQLEN